MVSLATLALPRSSPCCCFILFHLLLRDHARLPLFSLAGSGWAAAAPTAPRTKVPTKQAIFHLILLLAFLFIFTHPNHSFPPATVLMLTLSLTHSLSLSLSVFFLFICFFFFFTRMPNRRTRVCPRFLQVWSKHWRKALYRCHWTR